MKKLVKKPKVSIIIPTYNEELYLGYLLSSLSTQTIKDFEVLVVDGCSKDKTSQVCQGYEKMLPSFKFIQTKKGVSQQRNYGASLARADLFLFLDADIILPYDFLEKGIREFERKKGDVATCVSFPLGRSAFDFFSASVTNLSLGALRRFFPLIFGWTIFVKKTTHQKIGGFDPSSLFGFDDMTFKLKRVDNTDAVINFYPKKGEGTKPYYLMHALVAELKKEGKRNGEWIETLVKRERIIDLIKKQCPNENNVDSNWIKNTKGNLIKKIPQEYEGLIKIGDFNHKLKGYPFSLKIPF